MGYKVPWHGGDENSVVWKEKIGKWRPEGGRHEVTCISEFKYAWSMMIPNLLSFNLRVYLQEPLSSPYSPL